MARSTRVRRFGGAGHSSMRVRAHLRLLCLRFFLRWSRALSLLCTDIETGNKTYLGVATRSAEWYKRAQRSDGGMFRTTDASFQTTTFGQVTSGSACAAILWIELFQVTKDPALLPDIQKALAFVGESLVTNATDENMRGGVIEDSVDPGKCDASPYHLRDIAASFYMQALSMLLEGAAAELT